MSFADTISMARSGTNLCTLVRINQRLFSRCQEADVRTVRIAVEIVFLSGEYCTHTAFASVQPELRKQESKDEIVLWCIAGDRNQLSIHQLVILRLLLREPLEIVNS